MGLLKYPLHKPGEIPVLVSDSDLEICVHGIQKSAKTFKYRLFLVVVFVYVIYLGYLIAAVIEGILRVVFKSEDPVLLDLSN